jgi:hypothetical protein
MAQPGFPLNTRNHAQGSSSAPLPSVSPLRALPIRQRCICMSWCRRVKRDHTASRIREAVFVNDLRPVQGVRYLAA